MTWIVRRIVTSLVLVWVVASIVFLSIHIVPGDPAVTLLTQGSSAPSADAVEALRVKLGLDRPVLVQYLDGMSRLLVGDLGASMQDGSPVLGEILKRLPRTLELIGAAAVISLAIGIPAGFVAALRQNGPLDRILSAIAGLCQSIPVFVIGTVMILVFAQKLRWISAGGFVDFMADPVGHLALLLMPAIAIAIDLAATVMRITRSSVLDVMRKEYVRTARSKGVPEFRVQTNHVLRNALAPIVTVVALNLGSLLGGTVLVEYVFNWPGLSGLLVEAVNARDYPMVVGCILTISTLFVFLNLLVEIAYGFLDPRIRRA